jgi:hypothetical protein
MTLEAQERWDGAAKSKGVTVDEMKKQVVAKLQPLVDDSHVWIRVPPRKLATILSDKKFKSLAESKKMGSAKAVKLAEYLPMREQIESRLFMTEEIDDEKKPIYGYLSDSPDGHGRGFSDGRQEVDVYGTMAVKLKPSTRARTSMTVGDSLNMNQPVRVGGRLIPSMMDDVQAESLLGNMGGTLIDASGDDNIKSIIDATYDYVEAQVHGGVSLEDIDEIVFHEPPAEVAIRRLDKLGIPHRTVEREMIGKA